MRESIRRFARQDNLIGFTCSVVLTFFQKGPRETVLLIRQHHSGQVTESFLQELMEEASAEELQAQRETILPEKIRFSILVPLYNTPEALLKDMIGSVQAQTYPDWELCLADGSDSAHGNVGEICRAYEERDPRIRYKKLSENGGISENTNACIDMATGDYTVLLDHDDLLMPSALFENAKTIREQQADLLYSDEVIFRADQKPGTWPAHMKPDFAPDTLLASNYLCHLTVFRKSLLEQAGRFRKEYDGSQDHDLILRLTDCAEKIVHIPKVLYRWRDHPDSVASDIGAKTYAVDAGRRAVRDFLQERKGIQAEVTSAPVFPTMYRIRYPQKGTPRVSVIVYSEDGKGDIAKEIEKLRRITGYGRTEWLACRPGKEQNTGAALNAAVRKGNGEILLFVEAGRMPDRTDWIEEMLAQAQREEIGAVGARVLFRNGRIRHAGIVIGFGKHRTAGRLFFQYPGETDKNLGLGGIAGNVSAVTSECMMIRRACFEEAGGFEEEYHRSLYDADLCMKLGSRGYRNLCAPWPALTGGRMLPSSSVELGHEKPKYPADAALFRARWGKEIAAGDPYYSRSYSLDKMDFRPRG